MRHLILSAFADEYSDDLYEQLGILAKHGYGYIEFRHVNGKNVSQFIDTDVKKIKNALTDSGIGVSSIGSPLGKISVLDDIDAHIELAKNVCNTARELGTNNVRMFSFYLPEGEQPLEYRGKVMDSLSRLVRVADEYGVTLCHENEAKIYGESPERCLDILDYFDGKMRAVFDMGNFVLDGYKPYPDAYERLKAYIEYFHIKDALYKGAIVPAGKGEACIAEILNDYFARIERDTFVTLEPHLETFAGLNVLVGKSFENPYKYSDQKEAFVDAIAHLKNIIS